MTASARIACSLVRGYQRLLRPLLPATCRFAPSCSEYCRQVIETHGALRGIALGVWRVCRCHPWNPGGYDPPPPPRATRPVS
jgi:putative membrane protein insertion efficiency factor